MCLGRIQPASFHGHSNWLQVFGVEKIVGNCSKLIVVVDVFKRWSRKKRGKKFDLNFIVT